MPALPPSVFTAIADDIQALDGFIYRHLHTQAALVSDVSKYLIDAGGKRLRPVILLLVSGALGYSGKHHLNLAAVVEFIHTATLLHDDVVDESALRRNRPTANIQFGNPASVLVGDFLYSRAFQMMVQVQNLHVMEVLADATNTISEGEVLQLMHLGNPAVSEADYLQIIHSKTAKLFEASAQLAGILAGADAKKIAQCAEFGQALGMAFQMVDDVLDYDGDVQQTGKNLGNDLREGKRTLPLILALRQADPAQKQQLEHILEHPEHAPIHTVVDIVQQTGALQATRQAAQQHAQRALAAIANWQPSPHLNALRDIAHTLHERTT